MRGGRNAHEAGSVHALSISVCTLSLPRVLRTRGPCTQTASEAADCAPLACKARSVSVRSADAHGLRPYIT